MRILIGLTEIANLISNYSDGLTTLGHEVISVVREKNRFYPESNYSYILSELTTSKNIDKIIWKLPSNIRVFNQLAHEVDLIIYLGRTNYLPFLLDYPRLHHLGKQIISTFWGSDIRYGPAVRCESRSLGFENEIEPFLNYYEHVSTLRRLRICYYIKVAERYAGLILAQRGYGQLLKRPYMRATIPIVLDNYTFQVPGRKVPKILHAPSSAVIKGTSYILQTVEELKSEGLNFDFILTQNTPNDKVRKLLTDTDIVVDQIYSDTVGMLATEAMASGCLTLTRYDAGYAMIPADCPAVPINMFTLKDKLRWAILDLDSRVNLAEAGRDFIQRNYDHILVVKKMLDYLNKGPKQVFDFIPGKIS